MKKGKLFLIRHGESMGQLHEEHYRDDDTNFLSQYGVQQSVHCGKVLRSGGYKFPHVFSSNMTRARHTCITILHAMGEVDRRPDMISEQLRERDREFDHCTELDNQVADRMVEFYYIHVDELLIHDNVMIISHYHAINFFLDRMLVNLGYGRMDGELGLKNATPVIVDFSNGMNIKMIDMPWERNDNASRNHT